MEDFAPLSHTWDGAGDVQRSSTACVSVRAGPNEREYRVRAEQTGALAPDGSFALRDNASGRLVLPFTLEFDSLPASGSLSLQSGAAFGGYFPGSYDLGCVNARLSWRFLASDLEQMPAGDYGVSVGGAHSLQFYASWKNNSNRIVQTVPEFSMRVPALVQISGLDDIALPAGSGGDVVSGTDTYCVWSNAGAYTLVASSGLSIPDRPGSFALRSGAGGLIPYTVLVSGSGTGGSGTPVENGGAVGPLTANAASRDCQGADNGLVQVAVRVEDINSAGAGQYQGTLLLRVHAQ